MLAMSAETGLVVGARRRAHFARGSVEQLATIHMEDSRRVLFEKWAGSKSVELL